MNTIAYVLYKSYDIHVHITHTYTYTTISYLHDGGVQRGEVEGGDRDLVIGLLRLDHL